MRKLNIKYSKIIKITIYFHIEKVKSHFENRIGKTMQHPLKSWGIIISSKVSFNINQQCCALKMYKKNITGIKSCSLIKFIMGTSYFVKEKYPNEIILNQHYWDCLGKWRIIWTWDRSPVLAVQVLHGY